MAASSAPREPLKIDISPLHELPGVTVGRFATDGRLFCGVKDRFATVQSSRGQCEWWARGRVWHSGPGAVQIKLPGDVHREIGRDGPARFDVLLFDDALIDEARGAWGRPFADPSTLSLDAASPLGARMARLHAKIARGADPLALQEALADALTALVELTSNAHGAEGERCSRVRSRPVRRALEWIEARLTEPISLDDMAVHAGLDKFHLCRAFREEMGLPPYAYVTHRRVGQAQTLLSAGVWPSELAARVGFYDQSQLNRHFKRIIGTTPGQYAMTCRSRRVISS